MSVTANQAWAHRFNDTLHLVYQQKGSQIQNLIDPGMVNRDVRVAIDHHERLGNVIANDTVVPFAEVVPLNPEHSKRAVRLQSSEAPVWVSDEHTLRSMVDPQNKYLNSMVFALGRRADKHIIDALRGSAMTAAVTAGTGAITYGTQALASAHQIGAASAITLARIINAAELLSKASVPNGAGERIFLYSPGQLRDILAITQASSSDFTKNQIHDKGTIDRVEWEGFRWIEIADVVAPNLTVLDRMLPVVSTSRYCLAFHKGAVGLSIGKDISTKIAELPARGDTIQVRATMMMGAVRVWEGGVVQVETLEN